MMYQLNKYGKTHTIEISAANYYENDNLAIRLICWDEGWPEPWSTLTVNLSIKLPSNRAFVDTNNNGEDIIDWITENGLGKLTGRVEQSGFCLYPEVEFDLEKLNA